MAVRQIARRLCVTWYTFLSAVVSDRHTVFEVVHFFMRDLLKDDRVLLRQEFRSCAPESSYASLNNGFNRKPLPLSWILNAETRPVQSRFCRR